MKTPVCGWALSRSPGRWLTTRIARCSRWLIRKKAWFGLKARPQPGRKPSAVADAVQHLLHLGLVLARCAHGDDFALEAAATRHRLEGGVVELHALGHRPFVVAVGKVLLRFGAGQVLEEFDGVGLILRVAGDGTTGHIDVRAPAGLVGEHHP